MNWNIKKQIKWEYTHGKPGTTQPEIWKPKTQKRANPKGKISKKKKLKKRGAQKREGWGPFPIWEYHHKRETTPKEVKRGKKKVWGKCEKFPLKKRKTPKKNQILGNPRGGGEIF